MRASSANECLDQGQDDETERRRPYLEAAESGSGVAHRRRRLSRNGRYDRPGYADVQDKKENVALVKTKNSAFRPEFAEFPPQRRFPFIKQLLLLI
ncbi:hypothetical protein F2P81_004260 [Scophthalmus maximus]|uniref:Uncharacterized protein n=1 Tax=Scophthalmus maximus TaxID=52904 RepID=A0A6A4TA95_SCOMX|nr:hypothetical protein F2P81_004260 [Scophthalmus maximus]